MKDEIYFDGVKYISAVEAARQFGVTNDYVTQFCRKSKLPAKQVAKRWYVEQQAAVDFFLARIHDLTVRKQKLKVRRLKEYHDHTAVKCATSTAPLRIGIGYSFITLPAKRDTQHPSPHVPRYTITPFKEFSQKLVALTLAFLFTFGTFIAINQQYARFALDTVLTEGHAFAAATSLTDPQRIVMRAGGGLADIAADPARYFSDGLNSLVNSISTAVYAAVTLANSIAYALMPSPPRSSGLAQTGAVVLEIVPSPQHIFFPILISSSSPEAISTTTAASTPPPATDLTSDR